MKEEEQDVWAERTVRLVSRVFPDPRNWQLVNVSRCQAYMPHVRSCLDLIAQHKMPSPEAAQLLLRAGSFHAEQAHHLKEAEQLTQQALAMDEQLFGPNHPDVARGLEQLAWIYFMQRGEKVLQPELDMYIRAHEPQSGFFSEVVECLNTLALLYQDQGKHEVAEHYHQRAVVLLQQGWRSSAIFKVKREREIQLFEKRAEGISTQPARLPPVST